MSLAIDRGAVEMSQESLFNQEDIIFCAAVLNPGKRQEIQQDSITTEESMTAVGNQDITQSGNYAIRFLR